MPSAHGQESRERKFLLRMSDRENAYVRNLAVRRRSSLNAAITGLIRDAMDADHTRSPTPDDQKPELSGIAKAVSELPPAPARPAQKTSPRRGLGGRGRAGAAADKWGPPADKFDYVPGQETIPASEETP